MIRPSHMPRSPSSHGRKFSSIRAISTRISSTRLLRRHQLSSPFRPRSLRTLGNSSKLTVRFQPLDGSSRAFLINGKSGEVPLNPTWFQASRGFVVLGVGHIPERHRSPAFSALLDHPVSTDSRPDSGNHGVYPGAFRDPAWFCLQSGAQRRVVSTLCGNRHRQQSIPSTWRSRILPRQI